MDGIAAPVLLHHLFSGPRRGHGPSRKEVSCPICAHCRRGRASSFERKEATALLRRLRAGDSAALARARARHPTIDAALVARDVRLADAQVVIAREYGFTSWPRLVHYFRRSRAPVSHATVLGLSARLSSTGRSGIDVERFRPRDPDSALRAAWGVPPGAPVLGIVGRLSRQKGHQVLFEALPQIWASHPDTHIALIGAGELEADLRAQATRIDQCRRIHFVGQQEHMPEALAALDLFVLPSLYEGLSFAVLEAMAMERPIVATAVDGSTEAIEPEHSGILVPPGVPGPLAAAIIRLLGDPPLRARLGQAARAAVVAHFDQRQMLERTFALYE